MIDNDQRRRMREAFQDLGFAAGEGRECPPPDVVWQAANKEISARERREVIEHTSRCGMCALSWRLAVSFGESKVKRSLFDRVREWTGSLGFHLLRPAPLAAAAFAFMAIAFGMILYEAMGPPLPEMGVVGSNAERGVSESTESRDIVPINEQAVLSSDNRTLRWQLNDSFEAIEYEIHITDENLREIAHRAQLKRPEFEVPSDALLTLSPGTRLLWRVEARLADGSIVSQTFRASVR